MVLVQAYFYRAWAQALATSSVPCPVLDEPSTAFDLRMARAESNPRPLRGDATRKCIVHHFQPYIVGGKSSRISDLRRVLMTAALTLVAEEQILKVGFFAAKFAEPSACAQIWVPFGPELRRGWRAAKAFSHDPITLSRPKIPNDGPRRPGTPHTDRAGRFLPLLFCVKQESFPGRLVEVDAVAPNAERNECPNSSIQYLHRMDGGTG